MCGPSTEIRRIVFDAENPEVVLVTLTMPSVQSIYNLSSYVLTAVNTCQFL